jgi:hypothetical protein
MSAFVLKKRVLKLCWVTKSWARFGVPSSAKTEENNSRHFARDVPAMSTRGAGRGGRAARGGRGGVAITRGVVRAHPDDDGEYKTPKLSAPRSWHSGGHPPERGHPLNFSRLPPPIQPPPRSPLSCLSCLIHMLSFRAPLFPVVCGRYSHRRVNPPSSLMNHSFTGVPDHFKCCVCRDAPFGRIEQCAHGRDARRSSRNIDFTFNYLNMRVASRGGTAVELNGGARVRP